MARYFTKRTAKRERMDWDDDYPLLVTHLDVPDHEPSFTGLLDKDGDEIWRQPRPIGFGRDREWA